MKNSKDFNQDANIGSKTEECKRLRMRILRKAEHLETLKDSYNNEIDKDDPDIDKLYKISKLKELTKEDISRLHSEQQKLGCLKEKNLEVSYDNQTIISTSSVRRKDSKSLTRTPVMAVSFENKY